jgi:hypothetical protein
MFTGEKEGECRKVRWRRDTIRAGLSMGASVVSALTWVEAEADNHDAGSSLNLKYECERMEVSIRWRVGHRIRMIIAHGNAADKDAVY